MRGSWASGHGTTAHSLQGGPAGKRIEGRLSRRSEGGRGESGGIGLVGAREREEEQMGGGQRGSEGDMFTRSPRCVACCSHFDQQETTVIFFFLKKKKRKKKRKSRLRKAWMLANAPGIARISAPASLLTFHAQLDLCIQRNDNKQTNTING